MNLALIICVLLGVVIGLLLSIIIVRKSVSGDLLITSDEDGYYLSLELNEAIQNVCKHDVIVFKVKDISHK